MTDDQPMMGSGDLPIAEVRRMQAEAAAEAIPGHTGPLDALGMHLRKIERDARTEGDVFWERERAMPFEATNLAFLLRSIRSLLLILATEHIILHELREQQAPV